MIARCLEIFSILCAQFSTASFHRVLTSSSWDAVEDGVGWLEGFGRVKKEGSEWGVTRDTTDAPETLWTGSVEPSGSCNVGWGVITGALGVCCIGEVELCKVVLLVVVLVVPGGTADLGRSLAVGISSVDDWLERKDNKLLALRLNERSGSMKLGIFAFPQLLLR